MSHASQLASHDFWCETERFALSQKELPFRWGDTINRCEMTYESYSSGYCWMLRQESQQARLSAWARLSEVIHNLVADLLKWFFAVLMLSDSILNQAQWRKFNIFRVLIEGVYFMEILIPNMINLVVWSCFLKRSEVF